MRLTQEQRIKLHSATGISLSTIQRWLKGGPNNPSTSETLRKACEELGFRPADEIRTGYVIELGNGEYVRGFSPRCTIVRTTELSRACLFGSLIEANCRLTPIRLAKSFPDAKVIEVDLPSEAGAK